MKAKTTGGISRGLVLTAILAMVVAPLMSLTVVRAAEANLIINPSVEVANSSNPTLPQSWNEGGLWGDLEANYSYVNNGQDGSRSVSVEITRYTSGDAKWYFDPVIVSPSTSYTFSDYYKSTTPSELVAQFTNTAGGVSYQYLGWFDISNSWKQIFVSFVTPKDIAEVTVFHLINSVGTLQTDSYSLSTSTSPIVTFVQPGEGNTVAGVVRLTVKATDGTGIKSLQFAVDGMAVGTGVKNTGDSYYFDWDSNTVTNGAHAITAIATSNANVTAQKSISIIANNDKSNLVPNPSMENVNSSDSSLPASWQKGGWGTNTTTYSYLKTGRAGSRSVQVKTTKYTDGDAKWYFTPQPVTSPTLYKFTDYYKSTVASEVDAAFEMSDGSMAYRVIGLPDTANSWTKFSTDFTVPLGAKTVTVFHLIHGVGSLTIDDVDLRVSKPVGFSRPLVTLTFDDGYDNAYTETLPILQKYGFSSTQFIVTGLIDQPGYLTLTQLKALAQAGQEIGSHSVTHNNMLTETSAQIQKELADSQTQLKKWLGTTATNFSFPNGLYNGKIVASTKKYYQASRGVEESLNSKSTFNQYDIKVQNVFSSTTTAQVQDWINQAQATNTWLMLVYHSVRDQQGSDDLYNVTPTQLDSHLAAIKTSGLTVMTMRQALSELLPQVK